MDSQLTYHNGGAGIFQHITGPFAGEDPVLKMAEQRLPDPQRPSFELLARQGVLPLVDGLLDARGFGGASGFGAGGPGGALGQTTPAGWSTWSTGKKVAVGGGVTALILLLAYLALRREESY